MFSDFASFFSALGLGDLELNQNSSTVLVLDNVDDSPPLEVTNCINIDNATLVIESSREKLSRLNGRLPIAKTSCSNGSFESVTVRVSDPTCSVPKSSTKLESSFLVVTFQLSCQEMESTPANMIDPHWLCSSLLILMSALSRMF